MSHKIGDLQIWWILQIPMKPFYIEVSSIQEAVKLLDILAKYDLFQHENNIKPSYCNIGGLSEWVENCDGAGNPGWEDWYNDEFDTDDPKEYLKLVNKS